ncbi:lysophospholipase [Epithele typhae]|uniref:lysophospholipase n=1 Tax=Epithele typhae TaxID=378194 RepID=UPI002007E8B7|nr:lysophospholipase [Epithele typhae]KAH9937826.1 lysophospholipase [Epithele typhae]
MRSSLVALVSLAAALSGTHAQSPASIAYAPTVGACPAGTELVREVGAVAKTQTLSHGELDYVAARRLDVLPAAFASYLAHVRNAVPGTKLPAYATAILSGHGHKLPNVGIATSGGGHRAAIFGAGILNALDGRNATSARAGTGGLLQTATYLAGLSGGSWLVGSLAQNDFPTVEEMVFGSATTTGWQTQLDLLTPSANATVDSAFTAALFGEIAVKYFEGFPVTIADVWARALSRHFLNGTTADDLLNASLDHGAGVTLSSISKLPSFVSHQQPFPVVLANTLTSKDNGSEFIFPDNIVPLGNPIYEFNVYEMGSFDPTLGAFTPTKYLGSPNSSECVTGFDQMSFVQAISSNLFTEFNVTGVNINDTEIGPIIQALEANFPEAGIRLDTSAVPNPFKGVSPHTFADADQAVLNLVDGGLDGEVTPYQPLLVKARGVDMIFAIDAVADTDENWATGLSMVATQQRVEKFFNTTYSFPRVPTNESTFLNDGLTLRPTFFGCAEPAWSAAPLIIYVANGGPPRGGAAVTNTSTSQTAYPLAQVQTMLDSAFLTATQGMAVEKHGREIDDPLWPACLACAVVDRTRRDMGVARSGVCATCMKEYCWS